MARPKKDGKRANGILDSLFDINNMVPRTVKDIKSFLTMVMEDAVKEGIILYNPMRDVFINTDLAAHHSKEKIEENEFFSYEEAEIFLERVSTNKLYELLYVTLFFGLRRSEVLGLRWSAIDFANGTLTINHTVTKGTKINRLNTTKSKCSKRDYPLTNEQLDMFKRLKKQEEENRKLFGNKYNDNDYVFKHADGSLFHPDYPSKQFRKLVRSMPDLPQDITFHGLRTSCVSILVHEGKDIKSIQEWIGHADIDMTLAVYTKVKNKAAKRDLSDAMAAIIPLNKKE